MRRTRWAWALTIGGTWATATAIAVGCGGDSESSSGGPVDDAGAGSPSTMGGSAGSGGDGGSGGSVNGGSAGTSMGGASGGTAGSGGSGTGGVDPGACAAACDRVVACAESDCPGIHSGNSTSLSDSCVADCTADFLAQIGPTTDCSLIVQGLSAASPELGYLCGEDGACAEACQVVALCTEQECPAIDTADVPTVARGCRDWCTGDTAAGIVGTPCPTLIDALRGEADAGPNPFDLVCELGTDCADATACAAWAEKLSGCLVDTCDPAVADYATGLEELLVLTCEDPAECTSVGAAAYVNDPSVTCATDAIAQLGTSAPFANLCSDSVGATASELGDACQAVVDCNFPDSVTSVDLCMALMALSPDPALVPCLLSAGTGCVEIAACFPNNSGP